MSHVLLLQNTALAIPLQDESIHCIVTSPPYWGLRDYGTPGQLGLEPVHDCLGWATGQCCEACYLCAMVTVFRACWRVLRQDGTLFVNIGDSYNAAGRSGHGTRQGYKQGTNRASATGADHCRPSAATLKPKDLCGIPQRLALALQADGWTWRSEIIWAKPNSMPESVADRPTKTHEQVLLLSKQARYFWDQEAVREAWGQESIDRRQRARITPYNPPGQSENTGIENAYRGIGRNIRTVWSMPTEATPFAHFATMPTALVERCIKAGTSPHGVCRTCGAPWQRVTEPGEAHQVRHTPGRGQQVDQAQGRHGAQSVFYTGEVRDRHTIGFVPSCSCADPSPRPSLVYDPFVGSGTVPLVARALGRHGLGSDLSWPYLQIARERLGLRALAAWQGECLSVDTLGTEGLPLFEGREEARR